MDVGTLQGYRNRLEQEKKRLVETAEHMESQLEESMRESLQELSLYDNHPADIGDELFERSKDISLRELTRIQIDKVEHALQKINEGTYGICDQCGKQIAKERLDALPLASLCIDCKRTEEKPDRHARPMEEDVIPPFYENLTYDRRIKSGLSKDTALFDREDSWQAVERYGTSDTPQDMGQNRTYPNIYRDWDDKEPNERDVDHIPSRKSEEGAWIAEERI